MTDREIQFDWRGFLSGNPHVVAAESDGGGAEKRRHPRFRLPDAPVARGPGFKYKLIDFSRSGFGMFSSASMARGDTVWLTDSEGERISARVVATRSSSFDSSFLPAELRNLVHCEFNDLLEDSVVAGMLTAFDRLGVQSTP